MLKAIAIIAFSLALEAGFLLQIAVPMRAAPAAPAVMAGEPSTSPAAAPASVVQAPAARRGRS